MACVRLSRLVTAVALACCLAPPGQAETARDEAAGLFFTGRLGSGARVQPCAGCHGLDGAGVRDGGRDFPDITGRTLARRTPSRSAYAREDLEQALASGIAPGGRALSRTMPRYELDPSQLDALAAFLSQLATGAHHGRYPNHVTIGLGRAPARQEDAAEHAQATAAFRRAVDVANAQGGLWGRRLRLTELPVEDTLALENALTADPPLAVVLWPADAGAASFAARGIPELFPWGSIPIGAPRSRVRDLKPDWPDVLRAMTRRIREQGLRRIALIDPPTPATSAILRVAELEPVDAAGGADAVIVMPNAERGVIAAACAAGAGPVLAWSLRPDPLPETCRARLLLAQSEAVPDPDHPEAKALQAVLGDGEHRGARLGGTAALALMSALTEAGAQVNRRTLVEAFDRMGAVTSHVWPMLDWREVPATGTREIRFGAPAAR